MLSIDFLMTKGMQTSLLVQVLPVLLGGLKVAAGSMLQSIYSLLTRKKKRL